MPLWSQSLSLSEVQSCCPQTLLLTLPQERVAGLSRRGIVFVQGSNLDHTVFFVNGHTCQRFRLSRFEYRDVDWPVCIFNGSWQAAVV